MEFAGLVNESQFIPSNLLSKKLNNERDDGDSYKQYFDNQVIGFRPMTDLDSLNSERTTTFRVMHIKSDDVQDFEIPSQTSLNDDGRCDDVNNGDTNNIDCKELPNSGSDYSDYDYETAISKPQTDLLWSGPHWQIEKLLMDIAFAEDVCVNSEDVDEQIIKTILLNNGQDGSVREYACSRSKVIVDIRYNYPDQRIDEHSSVAFSFKKLSGLYYVSIIISDFTVTLDVPINPEKFCFDYLKRVLSIGGTFKIDK